MIGDRDEVHSLRAKLTIELPWIRIAVWKIEPPEEPFFRARAKARMNMEVAGGHGRSRSDASAAPFFCDPIAIRCRRPILHQAIDRAQDLPPDFAVMQIWRVNAHARQRPAGEMAAKQSVPSQARRSAPAAAHTVD